MWRGCDMGKRDFTDFQIFPFDEDQKFESFIVNYFNSIHNTFSFAHFGTSGQAQHGIDIYSQELKIAIQCKLKDVVSIHQATIKKKLLEDFETDLKLFQEYNSQIVNKFEKFIFASTFKNDVDLDKLCVERSTNSLLIEHWSWIKLKKLMPQNIFEQYYPEFLDKAGKYYSDDDFSTGTIELENEVDSNKNNSNENSERLLESISLTNKKSVVDSLYDLIKNRIFTEIEYVPIHVLIKSFFSIYSKHCYIDLFKLNFGNPEIEKFFDSFNISNSNEINFIGKETESDIDPEKIKYILRKLTNNLIFYVASEKEVKDIRFNDEPTCDCVRCQFERYEYSKLNQDFKKEEDLAELQRIAYVYYKLGNYYNAAIVFTKALGTAKTLKKHTTEFFISSNLLRLKQLLRRRSFGEIKEEFNLEVFSTIDLDSLSCQLLDDPHKETIKWLHSGRFFNSALLEMNKITNKIITQYKSSLNGGFSQNNYANEIYHSFLKFELFIQNNYLIFDCFNEYSEIIEQFSKGLYASHAIKGIDNSKLNIFNDFMLKRLLDYSKPENLMNQFSEYNLSELIYETDLEESQQFKTLTLRLLLSFEQALLLNETLEDDNEVFISNYRKKIHNALVLSGQIKYEIQYDIGIFDALLKIIESNKLNIEPKFIAYFIRKKIESFTTEQLKNLVLTCLQNSSHHGSLKMDYLLNVIFDFRKLLTFSKKELKKVEKYLVGKCEFCKRSHEPKTIVDFYNIADSSQKEIFKKLSDDLLSKEFNIDYFYHSTIFGVTQASVEYIDKYINIAFPSKTVIKIGRPFRNGDQPNSNFRLDQLLNILFKYEIDLTDGKYDFINEFNQYYSWLKDMENFNYELFDPNWITIYSTRFYFKKMYGSKLLKQALEQYIKTDESFKDQKVMNDYLNIYVRKSWEKF